MLKKILLVCSILAITSSFADPADPAYTYFFTPINNSGLSLAVLNAFTSNNNVGVSYTPGQPYFHIYDKSGGLPGQVLVTIGTADYTSKCIIKIFTSSAGAIWENPNDCYGPTNLGTKGHHFKKEGNFYTFTLTTPPPPSYCDLHPNAIQCIQN